LEPPLQSKYGENKSGNIFQVAEVVRNLALRDKEKGLSTGERKMLENAKHILVSEIVLKQKHKRRRSPSTD
jgi:RNA polymerase-interacting CarD/CdnL/TRCF family regulator